MSFVLNSNRSLGSIGGLQWASAPHGSGLAKRQATLQLCIRAEGEQVVRLALIFSTSGNYLSQAERDHYASLSHLIHVYFQVCAGCCIVITLYISTHDILCQDHAWADGRVMLQWLDQFEHDTRSLRPAELLLGMVCVCVCVALVSQNR